MFLRFQWKDDSTRFRSISDILNIMLLVIQIFGANWEFFIDIFASPKRSFQVTACPKDRQDGSWLSPCKQLLWPFNSNKTSCVWTVPVLTFRVASWRRPVLFPALPTSVLPPVGWPGSPAAAPWRRPFPPPAHQQRWSGLCIWPEIEGIRYKVRKWWLGEWGSAILLKYT